MRIHKHGSKRQTRAGVAVIEYILALTFVACVAFAVSELASLGTTQFQDVANKGLHLQERSIEQESSTRSTEQLVSHKVEYWEDPPVVTEETSIFTERLLAAVFLASAAVGVGIARKL